MLWLLIKLPDMYVYLLSILKIELFQMRTNISDQVYQHGMNTNSPIRTSNPPTTAITTTTTTTTTHRQRTRVK